MTGKHECPLVLTALWITKKSRYLQNQILLQWSAETTFQYQMLDLVMMYYNTHLQKEINKLGLNLENVVGLIVIILWKDLYLDTLG